MHPKSGGGGGPEPLTSNPNCAPKPRLNPPAQANPPLLPQDGGGLPGWACNPVRAGIWPRELQFGPRTEVKGREPGLSAYFSRSPRSSHGLPGHPGARRGRQGGRGREPRTPAGGPRPLPTPPPPPSRKQEGVRGGGGGLEGSSGSRRGCGAYLGPQPDPWPHALLRLDRGWGQWEHRA